ncbi:MAG: aldehyde dehydrogenase family protein [Gammaproteobacteria bacterium]|nr:aldehyde dehydrogenase family protein [Gammaproteobacteria bacterium]
MSLDALRQYDRNRWQAAARAVLKDLRTGLFIDGDYCDAAGGGRIVSINPANGEAVGEFASAGTEDVDRAVRSARKAFLSGTWSRRAPRERMEVMYRWREQIGQHAEELAALETLDMGKPVRDVVAGDLPAVMETIQFMAECIDKIEGSVTSTASDVMHFVMREPLGVVGAISPWNYPMLMGVWKVAPALAAGNCVVLKPAEQAPASCLKLAELFVEAGGPPGVFNVVNGIGEVAGRALALHGDVAKISFTGSTEVGKLMLVYAGQSNMKRVALECGGKSPHIFLADTPDLQRAAAVACSGIYCNMGEMCNAGSRLLVAAEIHDEFVERFAAESRRAYLPGDPLDPATRLGPLVTREAQQRVLGLIDSGRRQGAKVMFGGDTPGQFAAGAYVNPTLFTDVRNDMTIAREEIFGPVASVIRFRDLDEALRLANDTIYGLAAGIWTTDLNKAHRAIRELEAGLVYVNCYDEGDMTQPFGGYKQSGNARDKCFDSVLSYTQQKSAWIRLSEAH